MFTTEYSGFLFNIHTAEELPPTGRLTGQFGDLDYYTCHDGYGVRQATWSGSGFYDARRGMNVSVPGTINGVPVTELRQTVAKETLQRNSLVVFEAPNLKRVYVELSRHASPVERDFQGKDPMEKVIALMLEGMEKQRTERVTMNLVLEICGNAPDEIYISCAEELYLQIPEAKSVVVNAPHVHLTRDPRDRYKVPSPILESIRFSGNVSPTRNDPYDDHPDSHYFSELPNLHTIKGSLGGKVFWIFTGCKSLKNVHLSNGPERMYDYAFQDCISLEDVFIPDTVTRLGRYAMQGCVKLRSIHLPQHVQEIPEAMFQGCCSLEKCYLSDSISIIDSEAFMGCKMLANPWMPKNLIRIGARAFYGCESISMVTIPPSVQEIGEDAFGACPRLTIKGKPGSVAEQYALLHHIPFLPSR